MVVDFSSKLNFEQKQVKFIDKTYTVKTDHKTGLLLQELMKKTATDDIDDKLLKLAYGEKQYDELMAELEEKGENYMMNKNAIVYGTMSVLYNKPYEDFEKAVENASKN